MHASSGTEGRKMMRGRNTGKRQKGSLEERTWKEKDKHERQQARRHERST